MGLFGPPDEDIDEENKVLESNNPYDWVKCKVELPGFLVLGLEVLLQVHLDWLVWLLQVVLINLMKEMCLILISV